MCTETKLIYQQNKGHFSTIHTGVRHENWLNRWKVAPLAGGSKKWARKLNWFNYLGVASIFGGAALNLKPIYGLISLPLGQPATLSAVFNMGICGQKKSKILSKYKNRKNVFGPKCSTKILILIFYPKFQFLCKQKFHQHFNSTFWTKSSIFAKFRF